MQITKPWLTFGYIKSHAQYTQLKQSSCSNAIHRGITTPIDRATMWKFNYTCQYYFFITNTLHPQSLCPTGTYREGHEHVLDLGLAVTFNEYFELNYERFFLIKNYQCNRMMICYNWFFFQFETKTVLKLFTHEEKSI